MQTGLVLASVFLLARADAPGELQLDVTPTWRAVGIEGRYLGDDNANLAAEFEWRPGGEDRWRAGVDPVIDRKLRRIWASVGPLPAGTAVEVRLTVRDPDQAAPTRIEAKTTTRFFPGEMTDGKIYHVAPTGNDTGPGSRQQPFATIGKAAGVVQPGDTVNVAPGTYRVGNLLAGLKGTPEKPIRFLGDGAILDGGTDLPAGHTWRHIAEDYYSTEAPKDLQVARYAVQNGQRMFLQPTVAALVEEKRTLPRAWAFDAKTRTIHIRTGGKPAGTFAYSFGVLDQAFYLSGSRHVVLRGFLIRHYGGVGIRLSEGAEGCTVENCTLRELPGAFFLKGETTRFNLVRRCTLTEPGLGDYPWEVIKTSDQARQGVFCVAGRGNCFYENVVTGWFDGFAIESWKNPDKLELNRDVDVMDNAIRDVGDDAIEADGGGVNMRLWGNTIRNVHTALSLAPIERGPVWVARNSATFHNLFFKLNVGGAPSAGWTFCDHNTGVCLANGPDGGTGISLPPLKEECRNKVFRNNVLLVNEWSVRGGRPGLMLDGNVYWHVPGKPIRRFQWEGKTLPTLDAFRKATGQEPAGQYADPRLIKPYDEKGDVDLRLGPGSPCRDRGVRIRGVNDESPGAGPDAGAFEAS